MYGINAFALIFFCGTGILAYQLCKAPQRTRRRILRAVCLMLLSLSLFRYAFIYPFLQRTLQIPVEFSTVAFFAVPAILLSGSSRMKSWAAYSGLMAGFFYYMAMIFAGGPIYHAHAPQVLHISMLCHGALFFCGFVTIATCPCRKSDGRTLVLGILCVAANALLLRPLVPCSENLFIYLLLDGACIKRLLPESAWSFALPAYYIIMTGLLLLSMWGFFHSSRKQYEKFSAMHGENACQLSEGA